LVIKFLDINIFELHCACLTPTFQIVRHFAHQCQYLVATLLSFVIAINPSSNFAVPKASVQTLQWISKGSFIKACLLLAMITNANSALCYGAYGVSLDLNSNLIPNLSTTTFTPCLQKLIFSSIFQLNVLPWHTCLLPLHQLGIDATIPAILVEKSENFSCVLSPTMMFQLGLVTCLNIT